MRIQRDKSLKPPFRCDAMPGDYEDDDSMDIFEPTKSAYWVKAGKTFGEILATVAATLAVMAFVMWVVYSLAIKSGLIGD